MAQDNALLALQALTNLGYSRGEAKRAVEQVDDTDRPIAAVVRDALAYARGDKPKKNGNGAKMDKTLKSSAGGALATVRKGSSKLAGSIRARWGRLSPETRNGLMWAAGGIVAGGTIAIIAGRVGHAEETRASSTSTPASSTPAPMPVAPAGSTLVVVTPGGAQPGVLRKAAGLSAPRVDLVPSGTSVRVLGSTTLAGGARWYQVQPPEPHPAGWMHEKILRSAGA